jgi:NAD(P)-dependent dehydrogenase (short-subunit alcohol dehydrogenase family)
VNNVGIFEPKPFAEIPDEDWQRFFEVNEMSGGRLSRHYLKGTFEKKWGRIIFISSESGIQIPAEMVHYGITKTAQIAVARGIAETVAGTVARIAGSARYPDLRREMTGRKVNEYFGVFLRCTSLARRQVQPPSLD